MCDDETKLLLGAIYDRLDSDEYEHGPAKTIGGPAGAYMIRSPYNTECEYNVLGISSNLTGATVGAVIISGHDSTQFTAITSNSFGLVSSGQEGNALDGYVMTLSATAIPVLNEHWQPLGRGVNLYMSVIASAGSIYVIIGFRRKLDRVLHDIPRPKPSTHTPLSRRRQRVQSAESPMTAGAHNRLVPPGQKFEHLEPGDEDTGVLGYMQRRMRNIGR